MPNINGTNGTNGTNGANPTAGGNGADASFTQNGLIGADTITVNVKGGKGGKGGNKVGVGTGADGGDGGDAAITMNGNIFNNPANNTMRVRATATGGAGGLGGTGTTPGTQGDGGDANVTLSGNVVQVAKNMNTIELNAHAIGGAGTRYGNATAVVNGNVVQATKANNVILEALAEVDGPDSHLNHGNTDFGTKTATVNGNIVQGNIKNVSLIADAGPSNSTANINGNILNLTATSNGLVYVFAQGQHIAVTNNKFNLGKQTLELAISEFSPSYDSVIQNNEFIGTGTNTFVFSNNAAPVAQMPKDFAVINLATETFVFNGDSNVLKQFVNVTGQGNNADFDITGDNNANILNSGEGDDIVNGGAGNDTIGSNGGNDTLTGGNGNDTIDGGADIDTAIYQGNYGEYAVSFSNIGNLPGTVTDLVPNRDGADSLTNVEFIQFADGTYNVLTNTFVPNMGNTAPVATNDAYNTNEDTALVIAPVGVLGNDTDADVDPLTATLVTGPTNGILVLNPDGSFTYTPNADFYGVDSFTYQANDGTDNSNIATVNITVDAVNDAPPVATDDAYNTNEDTALVIAPVGVLGNDTDVDMDPLTAAVVTGPTNGNLVLNADGSFTYTPNANFNGLDSFTYQANDGTANSNIATVNITVNAVSDAPVATNDAYNTNEDTALVIAPAGVLGNDTDVENDPLTAAVVTGPTNGNLVLNADGSFTYTPNANFNGADSFTYQANDGTDNSNIATVNITVNAVNDAPVATNDAYNTNEDTALVIAPAGVLGNDTDVDMDPLTAAVVTGPTNGNLVLNADGSFTYTPNANFNGLDSFTYQANDGTDNSNIATVNITVNAVNDAPVATNDAYNTNEDTALVIAPVGVLGNDTDVENDPLTATVVTGPTNGNLVLNADGSFTYTPNADFNGVDSFTYQANDGTDNSNIATVNITVNAVNDAPVATNDAYNTNEDTALVIAPAGVLGNDTDVDMDPLTATVVTGPTNGNLVLNADGSFTYTPNANFNGLDSFTYVANDGSVDSAPATVNITVNAVNDAPVAADDAYATNMNSALVIAPVGVLGNDTDVDMDPLTAAVVTGPTNGILTLNPDGSFTYTPNMGYTGPDSFTYVANDGSVDSAPATVNITVNAGMTFLGTPGDDNLVGGPADDLFYATTGTDTLDGAGHINGDTVDFSNATSGVTANLAPAQQDFTASGLGLTTILNVENLTGSNFDDVLVGDVNRNTLDGGAGNDTLIATAGNDTLTGGANGAFGDTADFSGAIGTGVTVDLNAQGAPQAVGGGFGNVTLDGIENVVGSGFTDTLIGDAGNNRLSGGGDNDILTGGLGDDIIDGGTGIDTAVYSSQPGGANIGWNGSSFTVTGPDGTDELNNVEVVDDVGGGAKILLVGAGGYATINDAITAANAGDTIVIAPGTYNENVLVNKSVTLLGAGPGVVIQGTFEADNGIVGDVSTFLSTAVAYTGVAGIGIDVSADNVTLSNITVDGFRTGVSTSGASVSGLTLDGMTMQDSVFGFGKPDGTTLTGLSITDSTFLDSYIGVYLYNDDPLLAGASDAINTTITGSTFQDLTQKGIYAETAQGTTLFDNLIMDNVGQYGGGPAFGAAGANGSGIDINLKFNTYTGDLTISNFDFDDVGSSTGRPDLYPNGHQNAAAIAIKGRDDPGHALYGANPADVSGLNVNIANGSIDGTSTGIRAGEAGKANPSLNVSGPSITIDGVEITNNLSNPLHDQIDNRTGSLMTVQGTGGADVYHSAQTVTSSGPISFFGQGGNDDFLGGRGNDTFNGGADDDMLDGGSAGVDTAIFSTQLTPNDIVWNGTGYTVFGPDGVDTLNNIDVIDDIGGGSKILLVGAGGYATINDAIAAANAGDTILVAPGTYNENVLLNKSVTLMGAAPGVIIQGTFETDNGIVGDVNTFLSTAVAYTGAAGTGITVSADGVTISNITVDGFLNAISANNAGGAVSGLTLNDVTMQDSVFGFIKQDTTTLNGMTMNGGLIQDSYIGVYFYNDNPTDADAIDTTIDGTTFQDITQKGIYVETLQGNTLFDNLIMNNVGQYGGGPAFGAAGAHGAGIDLNLKFHDYDGSVTISNFDLLNVGSSTGRPDLYPNGHPNAAAIAVKGRDDPGHALYGANPADVSDLDVTIVNGSIDGTSTGIRAGEASKANPALNVSGPAVTVQNVNIENNLSNPLHDQIANHTGSLMTVMGNNQANVYHAAPTSVASGPIRFIGLGGVDDLLGGAGNDILQGGTGNDILDGGDGNDTADYSDATANNLNVNLNTGTSGGGGRGADTLFNIENALGSGFNDKLTGNGGVNMLIGAGGNDTLSGLGGNDILYGGAGDDIITGGGNSDIAYFSGHEWEYTTVTLANVDGLDGNDTLATVERLKFLAPDHVSDINNDGYGDLLYYRGTDGKLNTIASDGTGTEAATVVGGTFGADWRTVGTGTFRIDINRNSSLLLQDTTTGDLKIWRAGANSASTLLTTQPGSANWTAKAVGDFDGDGTSDVLLQDDTLPVAQTQIMFLGGNALINGVVSAVTAVPTVTGFTAVSSGDFNGDGKSDILWQSTAPGSSNVHVTLMDGAIIAEKSTIIGPGVGYTAYGTGDFDGDGKSDILFTDAGGDALIWTMDGTSHTGSSGIFAKPSAGSVLRGAEDYNRDGSSDLLWQDGGTTRVQLVNPNLTAGGLININNAPGATFTLVGSSGGG